MIYYVEDDESIRDFVIYTLNAQGMEARGFALPSAFWEAAAERGGLQQPPSTWKLETVRNFGGAIFLYLRPVR